MDFLKNSQHQNADLVCGFYPVVELMAVAVQVYLQQLGFCLSYIHLHAPRDALFVRMRAELNKPIVQPTRLAVRHRACILSRQKTSPPEATKSKSPERSGLPLVVFWEAVLPISKVAAVAIRLFSEILTVIEQTAG
jgi:hypothetical protein